MEVKIIERFTPKLVLAVCDCVRSVADECVANGLIPGGVRDDMLESTVTSDDKTRKLLKAVKNTTEMDSISFDIFLRILKQKLPERSSSRLLMDMRAELAIAEQAQANECAAMVPTTDPRTLVPYHDRGQVSVPRAADVSRLLSQEQNPYIGKLEESIREHERTVAEKKLLREKLEENERLKAEVVRIRQSLPSLSNASENNNHGHGNVMSEAEILQLKEKVAKLEEESNKLRMAIRRYRSAIDIKGEEIAHQLTVAYEKRFQDLEYLMSRDRRERDDSYSEQESDYHDVDEPIPKQQRIEDDTDIASNDGKALACTVLLLKVRLSLI